MKFYLLPFIIINKYTLIHLEADFTKAIALWTSSFSSLRNQAKFICFLMEAKSTKTTLKQNHYCLLQEQNNFFFIA